MHTLTLPAANTPALILEDERLTLAWPERAKALKIVDASTLQLAADERNGAKDLLTLAHTNNDPICQSAWNTWQLALADRKKETDPLEQAIKVYDASIIAFDREQKRLAAEAQRQIEAAAYTAEVVEQEKVIEHVENTGGSVGEVKSAIDRPVSIPVAPRAVMQTPAAPAKAVGLAKVRENWKGEVTDVWALVNFAMVGPKPPKEVQDWIDAHARRELISLLCQDAAACTKQAAATKGAMSVPGMRFWDEGSVASTPKKARL